MCIVFIDWKKYLTWKFYIINHVSQYESKAGMDYSRDEIDHTISYSRNFVDLSIRNLSFGTSTTSLMTKLLNEEDTNVISKCTLPSSRTNRCCWDLMQAMYALRTYVCSKKNHKRT
jgi:hypothetical protein